MDKHEKAYLEALTVSEAKIIMVGLRKLNHTCENLPLAKRIGRIAKMDIVYLEEGKTKYAKKMPSDF